MRPNVDLSIINDNKIYPMIVPMRIPNFDSGISALSFTVKPIGCSIPAIYHI
jgi:hypothetical protein